MVEETERFQRTRIIALFERFILGLAVPVIVVVVAVAAFFGFHLQNFKLDASSESLVLENDADLRYYDSVRAVFGSDDLVVLSLTPEGDLFAEKTLKGLRALVTDLEALESVTSVDSILSAPLFHSPKVPLLLAATGFKTLEMESCDKDLARVELTTSPLYRELLISKDGKTTALSVNFAANERLDVLYQQRNELRDKRRETGLNDVESQQLSAIEQEYSELHAAHGKQRAADVAAIRGVIADHEHLGAFFLGGLPMIIADMIDFVRSDIVVFGVGVLAFMLLTLSIIFRRAQWVLFPLLTCILIEVVMLGFLGFADWPTTVVSSNFSSLLFIITMSMAIHVVVRYRECHAREPELSHHELVTRAVGSVARPCLYCALTTMVGFGSLIVSGIRPVMDFGLMMTLGIGTAYVIVFSFFPAVLLLSGKGRTPVFKSSKLSVTYLLAGFTETWPKFIMIGSLVFFVLGVAGVTRLTVDNRFIDYFRQDTAIYKGLENIDRRLGGTTPLEVVVDGGAADYWTKPENLAQLRRIHDFLDQLPETGKVLSLDTMMRLAEGINDDKPLNSFLLNLLRGMMPADLKRTTLQPYVTDDWSRIRMVIRVRETEPSLDRVALLQKIDAYLVKEEGLGSSQFRVTGMFVLYNNLLQSLFKSQILTIGMVFFATWLMFWILFRSIRLAFIAIIPNIFPVILVLGALGWLGIPLDMMTIMIAAITIGMAVDHTIHYIHRFQKEFPLQGDYLKTMYRCHGSIGKAMYYTSVTIVVGFSILTLSNFIPTIYFGVFTGLAMIVALLGAMTLLPLLLVVLKPLGKGTPQGEGLMEAAFEQS